MERGWIEGVRGDARGHGVHLRAAADLIAREFCGLVIVGKVKRAGGDGVTNGSVCERGSRCFKVSVGAL